MLTDKELKTKEKLERLVPLLEQFISEHNPDEFAKWHNNCCLQTAFACAYILRQDLPQYKWYIKEGIFYNVEHNGKYNHGYVIGIGKEKNLLVDMARHPIWNDQFCEIQDANNPYADTNIIDETLQVENHDYGDMLNIDEYFTKLQGRKFVREFLKYVSKYEGR